MKKKILVVIIMLLLIDQGIKLMIYNFFMNSKLMLINNTLSLEPIFNRDLSYISSKYNLSIGRIGHILFLFLILIVVIILYGYIRNIGGMNKIAYLTFGFGISGVLSSLIDSIFWFGSLDYIRLHGAFTFDLKDIYISIVEVIIVILIATNFKRFFECSWIKRFKDIFRYLKEKSE